MSIFQGKIAFVGDANVGKTSIIYKYNNSDDVIENTIASNTIACKVDYKGKIVNLNVWDTAGQEDYRCLVPMFVKGSQLVVIVFDNSFRKSFDNIEKWLQFLENNCSTSAIFLVGNKIDLESQVSIDEIAEFAKKHQMKHFLTSALTGQNIDVLFYSIAEYISEAEQYQETEARPMNVKQSETPQSMSSCFC